MQFFKDFWRELLFILTEMSPYLMLGFFFAGLLHILFPKRLVRKYMGGAGLMPIINASLLGVPLPLCSCGVIPTGISFYNHGASRGATTSFLISTPQTGVDSILVTYSLMGLPFAIIRPIVAFFTGITGGLLTSRLTKKEPKLVTDDKTNGDVQVKGFFNKISEMFRYAFVEFLQDISKWLIIGILVAAAISVVIPDDFFANTFSNEFAGMILILIAAIPVYICATASVPIAAVLLLKGLSPGAALVLLMAGPATNAATITMIGKVMGKKTLAAYLISIITGAMLFGTIINWLPREWFSITDHFGHASHDHGLLPEWLQITTAVTLVALIIFGFIKKYFIDSKKMNSTNQSQSDSSKSPLFSTFKVEGMTCNHCKANVEGSLKGIDGVEGATADLATGTVRVDGKRIDPESVKIAIEKAGYTFKGQS